MAIEYDGASLHMEKKMDYMKRKIAERHAKAGGAVTGLTIKDIEEADSEAEVEAVAEINKQYAGGQAGQAGWCTAAGAVRCERVTGWQPL
jgi:hypothetical protein